MSRIRELASYREILLNLVRKELKVKYTASVLGAVWSLLNPIVFLAVFSFVVIVTGNALPHYPVYLLSGLLAWNLFSNSLLQGARSIVDNSNLVKKVYFPREILPLASIGVTLVDFMLQSAVLLGFIVVSGYGFHLGTVWLYPLAILTLLVFTTAMTFWVAGLNVRYRDVQHLLNLGLLVWFWLTPIVYQGALVQDYLTGKSEALWNAFLLNPLAAIVFGFQRALYAFVKPEHVDVLPAVSRGRLAGMLLGMLAASLLLLAYTWRRFFHLSGDFAEEL
ncbi:MAG TPA: ABC transporter permease [Actinomycetota bacterium]|nr:ABC transporter permease [Actinomycetota bacterium]